MFTEMVIPEESQLEEEIGTEISQEEWEAYLADMANEEPTFPTEAELDAMFAELGMPDPFK